MYSDISTSDTDIAKFEKLKDNFSWFYSNYDRIEEGYSAISILLLKIESILIMTSTSKLL